MQNGRKKASKDEHLGQYVSKIGVESYCNTAVSIQLSTFSGEYFWMLRKKGMDVFVTTREKLQCLKT